MTDPIVAAAPALKPRTIDGRTVGWADPKYRSRYRVQYKTKDGETRVLYAALEKQDRLHACNTANIWYGGAAGGAKSHALRWHGIINCLRRKGLKVLLLRRQYTELEKTHLLKLVEEVPSDIARYHGGLRRLIFPNGSIMQFGHAHHRKDVRSYLSTAWDLILIDESSEFEPEMLSMLQSRLRTKLAGIRPQLVLASNPGGEAHLWQTQRFILKHVDPEEDANYKPAEYEFIQALVGDNPYNDDFYIDRLLSLPKAMREAYLFGNMDAFAGQYFDEWAPSVHTIDPERLGRGELIEDWFEITAGMDWGYDPNPGIVLWVSWDPHGRGIVYKELKFNKEPPRSVAEMIVARCETEAERRMTIYGDPSMWIKQVGSGISIAEEINDVFAELGVAIVLERANNDRINGWMRVHQFLDVRRKSPDSKEGTGPYLRVVKFDAKTGLGCPYLISTIGAQMHSDKQDGDMKKQSNDHACDTLRYVVYQREPLSVLPRELVPGKSHENRVKERTRKVIAQAKKRKLERMGEMEDGMEIEDIAVVTQQADDEDDDGDILVLGGADDIWN